MVLRSNERDDVRGMLLKSPGLCITIARMNVEYHITHQDRLKPPYIYKGNSLDVSSPLPHHNANNPLKYLLIIIRPNTFQSPPHRLRILAHMLTIPPITAAIVIRKRRLKALKRHIGTTHNCLPHIIKAMNHVPVVVFFELVARGEARVDGGDGVEAVQLVRHGGCEDGGVGPDYGSWEVVVVFGVGDGLEAHAD
jgi:hypothetical protein